MIHAQTYDAATTSVIWSPGQDYVVLGRGEEYNTKRTIVDGKTGRPLATLPDAWNLIAIAPDGRYILASQHRTSGFSVFSASGQQTKTLTPRANVTSMRLTPQGDKALVGLADGSVEVFRTSDWTPVHVLDGHRTEVIDIDVSADGTLAYCVSHDARLFVWELTGFRNIYRLNLDPEVVWVVPDPRQEQVFTISTSGIMDARPLGSLAPHQLSDAYLKPLVCKIPRAIRKETPTTVRCDEAATR